MTLQPRTILKFIVYAAAFFLLTGERGMPVAPSLSIDQPLPYSVARPFLHMRVRASSATDSTRLEVQWHQQVLASFYDSIDNEIDFSAFEGTQFFITVKATDRNGATTISDSIPLFVESSPHLVHYFSSPDRIADLRNGQALTLTGPSAYPAIRNVVTGDSTLIPFTGTLLTGSLTPNGALLESSMVSSTDLLEFKAGTLIPLGNCNPGSSVVKGDFGTWTRPGSGFSDSVFLRDFTLGTTRLVFDFQRRVNATVISRPDVTEKGVVAFTDSFNNIRTYDNGVYKMIYAVAPGLEVSQDPLTDGRHTLFADQQFSLVFIRIDGASMNRDLTEKVRGTNKTAFLHYQVADGLYAYMNVSTQGASSSAEFHDVLRVLDTAGNSTLIDSQYWSKNIRIDLLSPDGGIMYHRDGRRLADLHGSNAAISSSLGRSFRMNGHWYVNIGRELFSIDLNPVVVNITSVAWGVGTDSLSLMPPSLFTDHFSGAGSLKKIRITALPTKGTLSLSGRPVNRFDEIPADSLSKLAFRSTAATGSDTVRWNASDGLNYAAHDAYLYISILAMPPKPIVEGMKDAYCQTSGAQQVFIRNYPDSEQQITVSAMMDTQVLVVNKVDSSIHFDPATLAPGAHQLTVKYANAAGHNDTVSRFQVIASSTPSVTVRTDLTHVTSPGPNATLTATALNSGPLPLYTFAADRAFQTILQPQGSTNSFIVDPASLQVGDNPIYVRVLSSATCPSPTTAIDSINIIRDAVTGLYDPDRPDRKIMVFPNPAVTDLNITGLLPNKSYTLQLLTNDGRMVRMLIAKGRSETTLDIRNLSPGTYFLHLLDDTRRRSLGTMGIFKK